MGRLIESHGGRVINTWGDGLIAEFPSVVEAVRAAVDTQNELAGCNAGRPSDGRMLFRIGINLGDVIVDGDDIYGDGVNIAARLQSVGRGRRHRHIEHRLRPGPQQGGGRLRVPRAR